LCFRSTAPFARSGKGLRRQHVSNRMMHDPPVARTNLCCLDPHVVSESSRNRVIDIAVRGIRFYGEILTHREHLIGFAYYPVRIVVRDRGQKFRVAFLCALIYPRGDRFDSLWAQERCVSEIAVARIGIPWWHLAREDLFSD